MSFMEKRVNMFLLLMVVLTLMGMGGLAVYYQYTFKDINTEYNQATKDLKSCTANFTTTYNELLNAKKNLNTTTTDIRKYDDLYASTNDELGKTKTNLLETQTKLSAANALKETYKRQVDISQGQINSLNATVKTLTTRITTLDKEIDTLNDKISCVVNTPDATEEANCDI